MKDGYGLANQSEETVVRRQSEKKLCDTHPSPQKITSQIIFFSSADIKATLSPIWGKYLYFINMR